MASIQLSDLQLGVLRTLWQLGEGSVADVHEAMNRERRLAVTTVGTLLMRLEKRGLLVHRRAGRVFVYAPRVTEEELRREMVSELTDRVFRGDVAELVHHLLSDREMESGDLEKVRALIEARVRDDKA